MNEFLIDLGDGCKRNDISFNAVRDLCRAIDNLNFVRLVEIRRKTQPQIAESVVIEVDVEVGQIRVNDIRDKELLAVVFTEGVASAPEVFSLRRDFPAVPHLNLRESELPRSLCLWEQDWDDLQLHFTGYGLIERIRQWLALTAMGSLHQSDQPMEPLVGIGLPKVLVLPSFLEITAEATYPMFLYSVHATSLTVFVSHTAPTLSDRCPEFVCWKMVTHSAPHGVISHAPKSVFDLHTLLAGFGVDLLSLTRAALREFYDQYVGYLDKIRLAFLILLPKTRDGIDQVNAVESRVFLSEALIGDIGIDLGVWAKAGGRYGLILALDTSSTGNTSQLRTADVVPLLDTKLASSYSGHEVADTKVVLVGAGALGSQVFMNLMRGGYGRWKIIDDDVLLPHNLCRHALTAEYLGVPKSLALAISAQRLFPSTDVACGLVGRISQTRPRSEEISKSLEDSDLILDCAASIPLSRTLARDIESGARRISLFMNPAGDSLVLILEDAGRSTTLDYLEMAFYRAVADTESLRSHFARPASGLRYGGTCRDTTSTISQEQVSLLAAIASHAIRKMTVERAARIVVWNASQAINEVTMCEPEHGKQMNTSLGHWNICFDDVLLRRIAGVRGRKLPKETGGVLIGSHDVSRRTVYVIDLISDVPDSIEYPDAFIRGYNGLSKKLKRLNERTGGSLGYVGEWHSHPDGCPCEMSQDDEKVLSWVAEAMMRQGLPGIILIGGEHDFRFHLKDLT